MENLEVLRNLVSIQSFDGVQNTQIIDYFIKEIEPYSKQIVKLKNEGDDRYNLIIGVNTYLRNVEAVVLSGHIDTVPVDKNYTVDPFEVQVRGGKAYGLGIIDMKCYFASIISMLDEISNLDVPVIICVTGDEETTLEGIEKICKYFKENNVVPMCSIIGEPTNLKVCNYSKGCYEYTIEIKGKGCHSSNPSNGINACYIMAKILNKLESFNNQYQNTTINAGIVSGGTAINIVPDSAVLKFDIRSTSSKVIAEIMSELQIYFLTLEDEYLGSEIKIYNTLVIPELEKKEDRIINEFIVEQNLSVCEFKAASEAGYFQRLGGVALLFGAGDLNLAHKADEYLVLDDYKKYNELFRALLLKFDTYYKSNNNAK